MHALKIFMSSALLIAAGRASAAADSIKFYGYAYDLKTNKYLYTEVYNETVDNGRWISGVTKYFAPDGAVLGEKKVNFESDPYIPVYRLDLPGFGYSEGITKVSADGVEMFKQSREKGTENGTVKKAPVMAADAGFHSFMVAHLPELVAGETVKFKFGVAGQLDEYSFRAKKTGDTQFEGKPAVNFMIEPDSLLRFAVDPLLLTYDVAGKRLLEYRGISNVINPATGKTYIVRITYYSKPPPDAPKNLPPL